MSWLSERFELSQGEPRHRLLAMVGLGGVAVTLVFLALQAGFGKTSSGTLGLLSLFVGLMVMLVPLPFEGGLAVRIMLLALALFGVCLVSLGNPAAWFSRALTWQPLRWLGNMSYSYYLLHGLALKGVFLGLTIVLPPNGQSTYLFWGWMPFTFFWTIAASSVLFLLIERRFSLAPKSPAQRLRASV